tara:strand:+ start:230 stop:676 length:447 start_codon:yes stop_codon:yes gene_type:complete
MKKLILFMVLMSLSFVAFNQTKERVTLAKGVLLNYKIEKIITNETDTIVYFYWGFKNQKYSSITDIGSFLFSQKEELQLFVDMLKVIAQKEDGSNIEVAIGNNGTLKLYDFDANSIYITEKNGKYTSVEKKKALQIASEIEQYIDLLK